MANFDKNKMAKPKKKTPMKRQERPKPELAWKHKVAEKGFRFFQRKAWKVRTLKFKFGRLIFLDFATVSQQPNTIFHYSLPLVFHWVHP